MILHHTHNPFLVVLSVLIAIFASYTALDLANSITVARGKARLAWLFGGSMAMGVGIWSMHFIAMLAFSLPGFPVAYDIFYLVLSVLVAIAASAIALVIISRSRVTTVAYVLGALAMGAAISGMHYIGIASMRMSARWEWDYFLVAVSIAIAVVASLVALLVAFRLRNDLSRRGFIYRGAGGVVMGLAISGMHYTAMAAMTFVPGELISLEAEPLLATSGLAIVVIGTTLLILGIALTGSIVGRALARRQKIEVALRAALSARDEFISVASHELKTPITSMRLQTQMLDRALKKGGLASIQPDRLAQLLETSTRQLDRLTRLVEDMLDISRISTGKLTMEMGQHELSRLVLDVLERFENDCTQAGCEVRSKVEPGIVGWFDSFRIEQVIVNLMSNAVKYGSGEPIDVSLASGPGDRAVIKVRDHGMGIPGEAQERIFNRFERAIPGGGISGLGLGLYIAKSILAVHHGTIRVESEPGRGALFVAEFPLLKEQV